MIKKYLLALFFALFTYISAFAAVSLDAAKSKVKDYAVNTLKLDVYELYSNTSNISKVEIISGETISVPASSWVFFLDEQPKANWEHNASVIFVSKSTGTITRTKVSFTPKGFEKWVKDSSNNSVYDDNAAFPSNLSFDKYGLLLPNQFKKTNKSSENSYALIISGGADDYNNHSRYWNDCSMFYQMLVDVYGYNRNNIYVLMADGTDPGYDLHSSVTYGYLSSPLDLDGDKKADIQRSATTQNISWAFDQLASRMTNNDNLFIFTTDHGAENGNLYLWGGEQFTPAQMVTQLKKLNRYNTISVCMEQCFSGAFVAPLSQIERLTITTAATAYETSCGSTYIDPYVYYWAMAMSKKMDADADNDSNISMLEAFKYAKAQDYCNEHPQYWSNGCDGERLYLNGPLVDNLSICCYLSADTIRKATNKIMSTTQIAANAKVQFQSYGNIILNHGFKVSKGAKFKGLILECNSSSTSQNSLRSSDINEDFYDEINPDITDVDATVSESDAVEIYPNPTDGLLYIKSESEIISVTVTDITGKVIMNENGSSNEMTVDLSSNAKGFYLLKVVTEDNSYTKKIVLK